MRGKSPTSRLDLDPCNDSVIKELEEPHLPEHTHRTMPEPVSKVGLCLLGGYAALSACVRGGSAISTEALAVRKAACEIVEHVESSQALFGKKAAAISQLTALANECAEEGWDEAEANAISSLAACRAAAFVRALPDGIPLPEFAPEPDGSVSLDWIQSRNRLFTLSAGISNRLAYAWLDGTDRGHAVARFDGENIPSLILEGIREIMNHGNAPLRTA